MGQLSPFAQSNSGAVSYLLKTFSNPMLQYILALIFLAHAQYMSFPTTIYIWIEYWPLCGNVKIVSPDMGSSISIPFFQN